MICKWNLETRVGIGLESVLCVMSLVCNFVVRSDSYTT